MIIQYPTYQGKIARAEVGKGYVVSLPFALSHPSLIGATLVAHKNIEGHGPGWTVTHMESSMAFAKGATKKESIAVATAICMKYDDERLAQVFQNGIVKFRSATLEL